MPRYVALLRGVSPMNVKMPELKRCFERAGFTEVRTLLTSGNVAFDARARSEAVLVRTIERAMEQHLDRTFHPIIRPRAALQAMIDADPYAGHRLPAGGKRVVTFLSDKPEQVLKLPIERDGARILEVRDRAVFSVYVPQPNSPAFMALLEKTYGKRMTTRTWDTVKKCAAA